MLKAIIAIIFAILAIVGIIMVFIEMPSLGFAFAVIIGIGFLLAYISSPKNEKEAEALKKYQKEQEDKKYNFYKYTCPMCASKKVVNISKSSKAISAEIFGMGSDKVGKCYQCDDCKYMW